MTTFSKTCMTPKSRSEASRDLRLFCILYIKLLCHIRLGYSATIFEWSVGLFGDSPAKEEQRLSGLPYTVRHSRDLRSCKHIGLNKIWTSEANNRSKDVVNPSTSLPCPLPVSYYKGSLINRPPSLYPFPTATGGRVLKELFHRKTSALINEIEIR